MTFTKNETQPANYDLAFVFSAFWYGALHLHLSPFKLMACIFVPGRTTRKTRPTRPLPTATCSIRCPTALWSTTG